MNAAQIINSAGLIIDILGAVLIFVNSSKITYNTFIYPNEELKKKQKIADRKHRLAQTGLALLIVGFTLQIVSNLIGK